MTIVHIDRSTPFDLTILDTDEYLGCWFSIVKEDERSLRIIEVDLSKVYLKREEYSEVDLTLLRPASHDIPLDAKVFEFLWKNQHLIPASWKDPTYGSITHISCHGTILNHRTLGDGILFLSWSDDKWHWTFGWPVGEGTPSAVLAS